MMNILVDPLQDFSQDVSQDVWQTQTAHDDCIFAFTTEVIGKVTFELEDELEENCMTVYVRTNNGKTISITCDKKQKTTTISENVEKTYRKSAARQENSRRKQDWSRSYD